MGKLYTVSDVLRDIEKLTYRKGTKPTPDWSEKVEASLIKLMVDSTIIGLAEGIRIGEDGS